MQSVALILQNVNCLNLGWGRQGPQQGGLGASGGAVNSLLRMSQARGWLSKVHTSLENTRMKVKIARERPVSS